MEAEITRIENEIDAQKATFEKTAYQMPVFTNSIEFKTSANKITMDQGAGPFSFDGNERVLVTFDTARGSNTLAVLEMTSDSILADLKVKRIPYSGGARWVVYDMPNYDDGTRIDTHYTFTVQSAVDGTLGAKMIWQ